MSSQRSKIYVSDMAISNEIDSRVEDHFESLVASMDSQGWNEETKREVSQQFKQHYRDNVHENITVNGVPWNESKDSKLESTKKNRKQYLNTKLIPEANEALAEVAKQRKTFPFLCAKEVAKQCASECVYEQKLKVKLKFSDLTLSENISPPEELQREELKEKTIPSQVDHAQELLLAAEFEKSCLK